MESQAPVTDLLRRLSSASGDASDEMLGAVYQELRRIAASELRGEYADQTLQVTSLVNEAVCNVLKSGRRDWADRKHFFATAACVMRRIVVDHARRRNRLKRGLGFSRVPLDDIVEPLESSAGDLEQLDAALSRLAAFNKIGAELIEFRFFLGLTMEGAADALGVPKRSAEREWASARAWLYRELRRDS